MKVEQSFHVVSHGTYFKVVIKRKIKNKNCFFLL